MRWASVFGIATVVGVLLLAVVMPATGARLPWYTPAARPASDPSCAVGTDPTLPAYDPANHEIYVPNFGSGNISVLKSSCTVAATIPLPTGAEPAGAAFDPRFNYIDVTDYNLDQVYEIQGTKIVATFGGFESPTGIVYDPGCHLKNLVAGCMVVANSGGTTVETLSGITAVVGPGPAQLAYDPFWDTILVTDPATDNVTVLNGAGLSFNGNVTVGSDPDGVAFDPQNSEDYVANLGSDNVTVLGGVISPEFTDGSISGFNEPFGVVWDQLSLHIFITNIGSGQVIGVSGLKILSTLSTAPGSGAEGVVYDDANCQLYVAGAATNTVYELA